MKEKVDGIILGRNDLLKQVMYELQLLAGSKQQPLFEIYVIQQPWTRLQGVMSTTINYSVWFDPNIIIWTLMQFGGEC